MELNYRINFVSNQLVNGHTEYMVKILGPKEIQFHIRDRYSLMSVFVQDIKRNLEKA